MHRLLKRDNVRFLHVYGLEPVELAAPEASELLGAVANFHRGEAGPMVDFQVADFRADDRSVLVVIQESC